eukprot:gene2012-1519_t
MQFPKEQETILLDGGLGTTLEDDYNLTLDPIKWSCGCLETHPKLLSEIHYNYYLKGADICSTSSYQCSEIQFPDNCEEMLKFSVKICQEARDKFWSENEHLHNKRMKPLVAASFGPYGACLGDGSEFTGNYIDEENMEEKLTKNFKFRIECLLKQKPDLFAFETFPSLKEVKILLKVIQENFPKIRGWISFSCKDEKHTNYGELYEECVRYVTKFDQIIAVGVNCTNPKHCVELMKIGKLNIGEKDLVCYPNSGELYDGVERNWKGTNILTTEYFEHLKKIGVRLLGGCCRTNLKTIENIYEIKNQ